MDSRTPTSPPSNTPAVPANNGVITQIKRTPEWIAGEAMGIDTSISRQIRDPATDLG